MAKKIRVVQCGLGFVGSSLVRAMLKKKTVECVGTVDIYRGLGRDVGELFGWDEKIGIIVSDDVEKVLNQTRPDVWIEATQSAIRDVFPRVIKALEAGANVITIAEEFADPWNLEPELTHQINETAKKHGVTIIGTGFNPGLWLDVWPFFLTGCMYNVSKITISYMSDLSPYARNPDVRKNYGFGSDPEEILSQIEKGTFKSSVSALGIMRNLADCLGLQITDMQEQVRPLVSKVRLDFSPIIIEPGQVHGTMVDAYGFKDNQIQIEIHKGACCNPSAEMEGFGDEPHTEAIVNLEGEPNVISRLSLKSVNGWSTTAPRILNWIPYVVKAKPGLLRDLREFPLMGNII